MKPLVLIPLYNERETIVQVLRELAKWYHQDVLVIDDGSTDGSREVVQSLACPQLTLFSHEINQGYGGALIEGFAYALSRGYSHVVTLDCDWQHEPCEVPRFLADADRADIVSGSRYLPESMSCGAAPEHRVEINRIVTAQINAVTGYNLTDAFCGLKCYRVAPLAHLSLTETGYAFPLQFWLQAKAQGLTVVERRVARIYTGVSRTFGGGLDNPAARLAHYEELIRQERERWGLM